MWFVLRLLAVLLASKRLRFAVSDFLVILLAGDVFDGRASLFDGNLAAGCVCLVMEDWFSFLATARVLVRLMILV